MTSIQLPIMTLRDSLYRSPKRKREDDQTQPRLITSSFRQNLDNLLGDRTDTQSPSTRVAGKFQKLGIQSPAEASSRLYGSETADTGSNHSRSTSALSAAGATHEDQDQDKDMPQSVQPLKSASFSFEMPSSISTLQSADFGCSRSPPTSDIDSDQFWRRSEITGYSPGDPDEDNYGVNGVGYQKSPAVAYAISQRRKQQIAEYRARETREARQRRGERRSNARLSKSPTPNRVLENVQSSDRKVTRFVRFSEG